MAAVSPSLPVDLEQVRSQLIDRMMRNGDWNKWVTSVAPFRPALTAIYFGSRPL
jgi:hypothetical protein